MTTRQSNSTTFSVVGAVVWIDHKTEHVGAMKKPRTRFRIRIDAETPHAQDVTFEVYGATVEGLRRYNVGDLVEVFFNIRENAVTYPDGKTTRYTNLKAWRIQHPEAKAGTPRA